MQSNTQPLADKMRPSKIDDIVGQARLLGPNGIIRRMVESGRLLNLILWGPPGCGKTTIARALANSVDMDFIPMSAVFSGTSDVKKVMCAAQQSAAIGRKTLLFIDEIHRFNKTQQDTLLPYLEDGTVVFIGATTENPSFSLNNALLSRCHVAVLSPLTTEDLSGLIDRAFSFLAGDRSGGEAAATLTSDAKKHLAEIADGDARFLLNTIEHISSLDSKDPVDIQTLDLLVQKKPQLSDRTGDEHYNLISAVHKSLRASDTDAALYWVARMMTGGQDPMYLLRRLTRFAMEDIGLADPQALPLAIACWQAYERMGSPEGDIALSQLVIYLGTAPKSNRNDAAKMRAWAAAEKYGSLMPPKNILNAPTRMMKDMGYGAGYIYEPDMVSGFSGQNCFPETMGRMRFYEPVERGFEREIKKRLEYWEALRAKIGTGN